MPGMIQEEAAGTREKPIRTRQESGRTQQESGRAQPERGRTQPGEDPAGVREDPEGDRGDSGGARRNQGRPTRNQEEAGDTLGGTKEDPGGPPEKTSTCQGLPHGSGVHNYVVPPPGSLAALAGGVPGVE